MFEAFYASPLHHPVLLWLAPLVLIAVLCARMPFLRGYLLLFAIGTVVDPLVTGPVVKWTGLAGGPWDSALMVLFVLLGDLRYFLLAEHYARRGGLSGPEAGRAWATLGALTLLVPLTTGLLKAAGVVAALRHLFLLYELLFAALAALLRWVVLPRRLAWQPDEIRGWMLAVTSYVLGYYLLWALADLVILAGFDFGFGLRLVPNLLYYGLFLPFVYWRAPRELR